MDPHLERARNELDTAAETASRVVETQLHSVEDGVFEEAGGEKTQPEPGPKPDRLAELLEKLEGLQDEAEGQTAERIAAAEESIRAHMHEHPR